MRKCPNMRSTVRAFRLLMWCFFLAALASNAALADLPPPQMEDGYLRLGFDRLASYHFVAPPYDPAANAKMPQATGEDQIPQAVKAWSGKKAIVTGFMLPVKMDGGLVVEFLLVKDP